MSNTQGIYRQNKRIVISYHFVFDVASSGVVTMQYTPTSETIADFLTKAVDLGKLEKFQNLCGLVSKRKYLEVCPAQVVNGEC